MKPLARCGKQPQLRKQDAGRRTESPLGGHELFQFPRYLR